MTRSSRLATVLLFLISFGKPGAEAFGERVILHDGTFGAVESPCLPEQFRAAQNDALGRLFQFFRGRSDFRPVRESLSRAVPARVHRGAFSPPRTRFLYRFHLFSPPEPDPF
jgi:hypothetical protein